MERNLRRYTNVKYPSRPKTTTEIKEAYDDRETMAQFGYNLRKTDRFYIETVGSEECGFTVFASHEMMRMVDEYIPPENRRFMLDGTFDVTPPGCFYQLVVIGIEYKKDVSVYLYILENNKRTD